METAKPLSRSVLTSIFKRHHGISEASRVVENLDDPWLAPVRLHIDLEADEQPVVAMILCAEHWLLITTKRSLYYYASDMEEIRHCHVIKAGCNDWILLRIGKKHINLLDIETQSYTVRMVLERGPTFYAFWNLYRWIWLRADFEREQTLSQ